MSDLQIGLVVIGVVIILVVLGFNAWQDRRIRQKIQSHVPVVDQDPLLGNAEMRREPGLEAMASMSSMADPVLGDEAQAPHVAATEEPDELVEVVIELILPEPVSGAQLIQALPKHLSVSRKPVRVFWVDQSGRLHTRPNPADQYESLQFAVLLANRSGPLTDIDWSKLWNQLQSIADALEGHLEGPEQTEVLQRASKLDELCATLDSQVVLTLALSDNVTVQNIVSGAQAMGFAYQSGVLNWIGDHGLPCFMVTRLDGESFDVGVATVDRISLVLDVPRSPPNVKSFGRMLDVGLELGRRFGGQLIDDQGRPVVPGSDAPIDLHLQELVTKLEACGLTAGGVRARRVFS